MMTKGISRRDSLKALGLLTATSTLASAGWSVPRGLAAEAKTIRVVKSTALRVLDPIITTAHISRDHGYMIYDTLLALDDKFQPQPQMASWEKSPDERTYTFHLRDGLKWHDGTPVTAEDCVASIKRWAVRDGSGQVLMSFVDSLSAADPKTIVFKLKKPFPYLVELMAKPAALVPFMMPKRVAETPATTMITDYTGSGPFKFVKAEYRPGLKVVYEKFEGYVPRSEPASWNAGGKVVHVDRVEWINMPDPQTAISALTSAEVDFIERVPIDLLPILANSDDITVKVMNKLGGQIMARMNFLYPPFDNVKIRRAAMLAMNQKDVLEAMIGNPKYYSLCGSVFGCGTPLESEVGAKPLMSGGDMAEAKKLLKEAGYDGTPVVIMQPTDLKLFQAAAMVVSQALRTAGFKVDLQSMDWQTLVMRRASRKPPKDGGWNMFFTGWDMTEIDTPLINPMLNGRGKSAWFGWPTDPDMDKLIGDYIAATSDTERKKIADQIQAHALAVVNYVPLGQFMTPWAWRDELTGILPAPAPIFWNMDKKSSI